MKLDFCRISGFALVGLVAFTSGFSVNDADAATTRLEKFFDNWKVECRDDEKTKNCALVFALLEKKSKRVVFSWTVSKDTEAKNLDMALIRTPTGVLLPDGVSVSFAGSEAVSVPFKTCGPRGCIAELKLDDQWLKALGSQETMSIAYKSVRGQDINHEITLKTFSEAYAFYKSEIGTQ